MTCSCVELLDALGGDKTGGKCFHHRMIPVTDDPDTSRLSASVNEDLRRGCKGTACLDEVA